MTLTIKELVASIYNEADYALRFRNGEDVKHNQEALINVKALSNELAARLEKEEKPNP